MIHIDLALKIHQKMIDQFGGSTGVRDMGALNSALNRPFQGFGDTDFYPEPEMKAAAVMESVLTNHPFVDGNKRTGYVLMRLLLRAGGREIDLSQSEKYDFTIKVATGKFRYEEIHMFLKEHTVPFSP